MLRLKTGVLWKLALASEPSWIASMIARVYFSGQRLPWPKAPPVQLQAVAFESVTSYRSGLIARRDEPGVDEPAVGLRRGHLLREHGRVTRRVQDNEGSLRE